MPEEAVEDKARMSEEADETELVKKNFLDNIFSANSCPSNRY